MKKKILFIIPSFNFGGTVFSTLNMISFLKEDYFISVLPMTYQGAVIKNYIDANINLLPESFSIAAVMGKLNQETNLLKKLIFLYHKILRYICSKLGFNYTLWVLKKEANKIENNYSFDYVVACQEITATYFASFFSKTNRIAWFRSEYSIYKTEHNNITLKLDQQIYPKFNKIVCVSNTTRNDFVKFFPELDNKIISIYNIQNVKNIEFKATEMVNDFPESEFVIVSVGRMNPQKRFSAIPGIAKKLVDAGCNFKWIILGEGNTFGEWDKLQYEIYNNQVDKTVICLGSKLNPYPYIKKANLLVNTSYIEACPRVVIEAKILKTPVICADFSSANEFVSNGIDGFVDTIDMLYVHIADMILDKQLYKYIKDKCDSYKMDNMHIYKQLRELFS